MYKWISGYLETLYLMRSRENRKRLRESILQVKRGETTAFILRNGNALMCLRMLIGTELDLEANCAYVRIHECGITETLRFDEETNLDFCSDGEIVGVEILDLKACLSAPTCAGTDVEESHSKVEEAVLLARSFVLQDLMKSGLYDHRPIHKFY